MWLLIEKPGAKRHRKTCLYFFLSYFCFVHTFIYAISILFMKLSFKNDS
jgi:hypothetical protein